MINISIIIPTYNREQLIKDTLHSVEAQSSSEWECIVVDDGSTDKTFDVVNEFVHRDSRFKYLKNQRTKGAQGARNTGIIASKGEWICFLDSDDHLLENSLKDRIEAWKKKQCSDEIALVYGDYQGFEFEKINGSAYRWMIKNMALCPFSVMLVRKNLVFNGYLLDEKFPAWQDDDFVFEVTLNFNVLHCGKAVTIVAPKEKEDSITMSKKKLINGMSLMIRKRKKVLLSDGSIGRIIVWYLRLLTSKIELFSDKSLNKKKFVIIRKIANLCVRLMRKLLANKFDVIYS